MSVTPTRYEFEDLVILVSRNGDRGRVVWLGTSDARNASELLNPLSETVVDTMRGAEVTVDFTRLEFMNSSTVSPIINLVRKLDANQIPVRVLFVEDNWQRTHLRCVATIARKLDYVTVEGRSTATDDSAKEE